MQSSSVPGRITVDFSGFVDPSKAWIIGISGGAGRVVLTAFEPEQPSPGAGPEVPVRRRFRRPAADRIAALAAPCTCPDFCERDHANE